MCPQCAQALSATDKFCRHCGFAMTSMQNDVQPAQPRRTGLAGLVLWQKLLLAFVALLVVLAVSTWLMMRDSASKVFKTPAHQPTLSETPFSLDGSRGNPIQRWLLPLWCPHSKRLCLTLQKWQHLWCRKKHSPQFRRHSQHLLRTPRPRRICLVIAH